MGKAADIKGLTDIPVAVVAADGVALAVPDTATSVLLTLGVAPSLGIVASLTSKSRPGRLLRITADQNGWGLMGAAVPTDGQIQAKGGTTQLNLNKNQTALLQQQANGSWLVIETTGAWS